MILTMFTNSTVVGADSNRGGPEVGFWRKTIIVQGDFRRQSTIFRGSLGELAQHDCCVAVCHQIHAPTTHRTARLRPLQRLRRGHVEGEKSQVCLFCRSTQPCIPPGSLNRLASTRCSDPGRMQGRNVITAGWQVTLCDPVWHVSSCSCVAILRTAIPLLHPPLGLHTAARKCVCEQVFIYNIVLLCMFGNGSNVMGIPQRWQ